MFIKNKYYTYYYNIVNNALSRSNLTGYFEKHHIIPKSLGGGNSKENLVNLTFREHFICHRLLTKITSGINRKKMIYAIWRMSTVANKRKHKITARTYQLLREDLRNLASEANSGKNNPMYGKTHTKKARMAVSNAQKGNTTRRGVILSKEQKQKQRESMLGKPAWNKGIPRPQSVKDAVSKANKGKTAWNKGISRRWVTKDNINKLVYPNDLDTFLKEGWTQGRCS